MTADQGVAKYVEESGIAYVAAEEKREKPQDMRFQTGFDLELSK
jgi:hypothetical protein